MEGPLQTNTTWQYQLLPQQLQSLDGVADGLHSASLAIHGNMDFSIGSKHFRPSKHVTYGVDNHFWSIFDFQFREGDAATALSEPNTAVITESLADTLFPQGGAVGEVFELKDELLTIVGVVEDLGTRSHLSTHEGLPFSGGVCFTSKFKECG